MGAVGAAVFVGMIVYWAEPLAPAPSVPVPSTPVRPESRGAWTKNLSLTELPAPSRKSSVTRTPVMLPLMLPLSISSAPLKADRVSVAVWLIRTRTCAHTPASAQGSLIVGARS